MKALFENLPEGIILYTKEDHKALMVNSEFKRLFKISDTTFDSLLDYQLHNKRLLPFEKEERFIN